MSLTLPSDCGVLGFIPGSFIPKIFCIGTSCSFTWEEDLGLVAGYVESFCVGVVGWCEGVMYLMSPGRPADIGLQLGKACYPCSR